MAEEHLLKTQFAAERLFQLDALRGIAAITVVAHHIRNAYHDDDPSWYAAPLFAGHEAVILFFVLSGYVLSLPFWKARRSSYTIYLLRRFTRIYFPFILSFAISLCGMLYFGAKQLPLGTWFYQTWQEPVSLSLIVKQLFIWPMSTFNTAFWSLRYEMQMSITMPLLCMLMLWCRPMIFTVLLGLLVYGTPAGLTVGHASLHFADKSIQVMFLFALGGTLAYSAPAIQRFFHWLGLGKWVVLAVSFFMYYGYPLMLIHGRALAYLAPRRELVVALGAAGILLSSLHLESFAKVLKHAIPEYLGRISYSLYLVHGIAIFSLFGLLFWHLPTGLLIPLMVGTAFAFAHMFCVFVEEPFIKLGRRISRWETERNRMKSPADLLSR